MTSPGATTTRRPTRSPRRFRLGLLVAVVGPGLLARLSDDDSAGITTYSVLGAQYGYQLLWVLLASTVALIIFHTLAARMGVVTGQGLIGLVRDRYGVRLGALALVLLVIANLGTACAEVRGRGRWLRAVRDLALHLRPRRSDRPDGPRAQGIVSQG